MPTRACNCINLTSACIWCVCFLSPIVRHLCTCQKESCDLAGCHTCVILLQAQHLPQQCKRLICQVAVVPSGTVQAWSLPVCLLMSLQPLFEDRAPVQGRHAICRRHAQSCGRQKRHWQTGKQAESTQHTKCHAASKHMHPNTRLVCCPMQSLCATWQMNREIR